MLLTTNDVARRIGRSPKTVWAIAKRLGIGVAVGTGRTRYYTEADIPRFLAVNALGGRPPKDGRPVTYKADPASVKKGRKPTKQKPET